MLSACDSTPGCEGYRRVGKVRHRSADTDSGQADRGYTAGLPSDPKLSRPSVPVQAIDTQVEAARHVLFGRVLPALRHALVGELQALRFGVSIVRASTVPADVATAIDRLGDQAGKAIARADAITRWFQPDEQASIAVGQAIGECLELVDTECQMRGILLVHDLDAGTSQVRSRSFCELLLASLLALGDDLSGAADVTLRTRQRASALWLTIRGDPADREGEEPGAVLPRRLRWEDVDALARAHSIVLRRRGHRVAVRFPVVSKGS